MAEDVGGGEEGGGEAAESTGGPGSKVETHTAPEGAGQAAIDEIDALDCVRQKGVRMRVLD